MMSLCILEVLGTARDIHIALGAYVLCPPFGGTPMIIVPVAYVWGSDQSSHCSASFAFTYGCQTGVILGWHAAFS
jgi:hypothetical protein